MALIVGEQTIDTESIIGSCRYPAQALGGAPTVSPNVYVNGQPLRSYDATSVPSDVTGIPLGNNTCAIGTRQVIPSVNTTVYINGKLPALSGDNVSMLGTTRPLPLTNTYVSDTIKIQENLI